MDEKDKQKLLTQALRFNSDFCYLLSQQGRRILPRLTQGIVQQPRRDIYWKKECGTFQVIDEKTTWSLEPHNDTRFYHWQDYDNEGERYVGLNYKVYEECEGEMVEIGEQRAVHPEPSCLLYAGEWCYLESHPDVIVGEEFYARSVKAVAKNTFPEALKKIPQYQLFRHCISIQKPPITLHDDLAGSDDDRWLFEMACLRILAGGMEMYFDPLRTNEKTDFLSDPTAMALEAELGRLNIPSQKTILAAKKLIRNIQEDGHTSDDLDAIQKIAKGESYISVRRTSPIKAMVREMSLLGKDLLNIQNGHKNRFPASAIQQAVTLVGDEISKQGIAKHQALYDDSDGSGLTKGRSWLEEI
jgi:hypothetical protein